MQGSGQTKDVETGVFGKCEVLEWGLRGVCLRWNADCTYEGKGCC